MPKHYLVAYTTKKTTKTGQERYKDEYYFFKDETDDENLQNAKEKYNSLIDLEEVYSATIGLIVESTD